MDRQDGQAIYMDKQDGQDSIYFSFGTTKGTKIYVAHPPLDSCVERAK